MIGGLIEDYSNTADAITSGIKNDGEYSQKLEIKLTSLLIGGVNAYFLFFASHVLKLN